MPEEYKLLDKSTRYDVDTVRELAKALNEFALLESRMNFLKELITDNENLKQYLHRTKDNHVVAIADLEDGHLSNLMAYLVRNGDGISKELAGEARKRNIAVPTRTLALTSGEDDDEDYDGIDLMDF